MIRTRTPVLRIIAGAVALALGVLLLPLGAALPFAGFFGGQTSDASWSMTTAAVVLIGVAALSWVSAIRSVPGDDIMDGERSTLLSVMIVLAILIVVGTGWIVTHGDFWQGFFDGFGPDEHPQ